MNTSYRESHKDKNNGVVYDHNYSTIPWRKFLWEREQKILIDILEFYYKNKNIAYLDFACGTGRITSLLENKVKTSTAVDISHSMLKRANQKLINTQIIEHDLTESNILKNKRYNLITAFRFFLNAEDDLRKQALEVISSLLSKDGYFIFNNHANWSSPFIKLMHYYGIVKSNQAKRVLSQKHISELLNLFDLEIIRVYPVGYINFIKFTLPNIWNHRIDSFINNLVVFNNHSESPIIVAKAKNTK